MRDKSRDALLGVELVGIKWRFATVVFLVLDGSRHKAR